MTDLIPFSDLRLATYCPRKLYYARREDDRKPPPEVQRRRELAFRYPDLLDASDDRLCREPIDVSPATFRSNLADARSLDDWPSLADPPARDVLLEGREAIGVAHKVLPDPPRPSIVATGDPPERGVWRPKTVQAVAAAKALAYERERPVERAYVEFPTHGIVRSIELNTRRKAAYRTAVRAVRSIDGPPGRIDDRAKCDACEYSDQCGVRTRTLRSLLPGG